MLLSSALWQATAYAHQQAASQASTDSACRHPVWLPHSSLGFQRPVGRRSYHKKARVTGEVCVEWAGISLPMYDIGLQLLGVRDDS